METKDKYTILAEVVLLLGVLGSICLAVLYGKMPELSYSGVVYERNWPMTIGILIGGCLLSVMSAIFFEFMSEVVGLLFSIKRASENEKIMIKSMCELQEQKYYEERNQWKCSTCGRIHDKSELSCLCGKKQNS